MPSTDVNTVGTSYLWVPHPRIQSTMDQNYLKNVTLLLMCTVSPYLTLSTGSATLSEMT